MKKQQILVSNFCLFTTMLILLFSCGSDDTDPMVSLSSEKEMINFEIDGIVATIDNAAGTITATIPEGNDLTSLTPTIEVSPDAQVSPSSGDSQDFTNDVIYTVTAEDGSTSSLVASIELNICVDENSISDYILGGTKYELVKTAKSYMEAAKCAKDRGGYLAEFESEREQDEVFVQIKFASNIDLSQTVSVDGGDASYVWIGGNDFDTEGSWVWDGNLDGNPIPFWNGDTSGMPVDSRFTNWGNGPDNADEQDALAMALTNWPSGQEKQWNDLKASNKLYYLIEYD